MDWTGCELVERIPGKVSGQPIVRGTRILADTIVSYADRGASTDEILGDYPALTVEVVESLVAFANAIDPPRHHGNRAAISPPRKLQ